MKTKKNTTLKPKADSAEMETPAFKLNPWVGYKWILTEPFQTSTDEEASKQTAQDELTAELNAATQDFIIEDFNWTREADDVTYHLKVKLKPVHPPSTGVKSPQPPPPPPTFP